MVEFGPQPGCGRVAHGAVVREAALRVRRIGGCNEFFLVASITSRRRSFETVVDVASGALQRGMHAGESKARHLQVIEAGSEPVVNGMTGLACSGEARLHVIDNSGLEVLLVTGITGR